MIKLFHAAVLISFLLLFPAVVYPQDVDIIPYLKQIENGQAEEVKRILPDLKQQYTGSPSVLFLEGVLTENGEEAVKIYNELVTRFPGTRYADAALFRIYSYYYALGLYNTANNYLEKLKREYPDSPYIKVAGRNIPEEDELIPKEKEQSDQIFKDTGSVPTADYRYSIQAGAFSKPENANQLQKKFSESGLYSEIFEKEVAGTTFHVVYVGKYRTESEAANYLSIINRQFGLTGRIVEIK